MEKIQECKRCINTNRNPFVKFNKEGFCDVCQLYLKSFDKKVLTKELNFSNLLSVKGKANMT